MHNEFSFDGFHELILAPLGNKDPRSFEIIQHALREEKHPSHDPFRFLIQFFINKKCKEREARDHWRLMIRHKENLEGKLGRRFGVHAALHDYFDCIDGSAQAPGSFHLIPSRRVALPEADSEPETIAQICSPGNHAEIFKKEVFRAKRYKHSLSAIMLDVDDFPKITQLCSDKSGEGILVIIVKIIKKTIRIVDILFQYSGHRFLIILPNTNKREAIELSERIRQNICERTKRVFGSAGVTATLSVGQTLGTSNAAEFARHLETMLDEGKKRKCNTVYSL
jgi:diguanylate cyclase (GGDEF)-like protein